MRSLALLAVLIAVPAMADTVRYGGRTYNTNTYQGCSSPNCGMCAYIRSGGYTTQQRYSRAAVSPAWSVAPASVPAGFTTFPVPHVTTVAIRDGSAGGRKSVSSGVAEEHSALYPPAVFTDIATPEASIDAALAIMELKRRDVLYDLGCGDGRVLIRAARLYGARGIGIEINPETAKKARRAVDLAGYSGRIRIVEGDATKFDLSGADAIYCYLYPETLERLTPKLSGLSGITVVSRNHDLPGLNCEEWKIEGNGDNFYVWKGGDLSTAEPRHTAPHGAVEPPQFRVPPPVSRPGRPSSPVLPYRAAAAVRPVLTVYTADPCGACTHVKAHVLPQITEADVVIQPLPWQNSLGITSFPTFEVEGKRYKYPQTVASLRQLLTRRTDR